jgi:2-polyprenyl-6-methoxyphenol hydroxylase-like FAD-dependent oxidoreductase
MARILVLGAGLGGLATATLLARDGHEVTVVERDPDAPPDSVGPDQAHAAWAGWQRRGVNQFRLSHFMLPAWWAQVRTELPEVGAALLAAGATRINMVATLPEARRGPARPDDDRFETVTARRPVLELALAAAAEQAGVTVRRGVTVTGVVTEPSPAPRGVAAGSPAPRVTGVLTDDGEALRADLVVDCGGRRSALAAWLVAAGARRPAEEREDCGFVYYARHFRSADGTLPAAATTALQPYDSVSLITLACDNGTWTVVVAASAQDRALRALREPDRWQAALARYPLAAHWATAGEPISGVDVMAGIEDRHRRLVVDGTPVATGVVAVGDAWACTNPSLGRGAAIALIHARLLRDLLRDTDPGDHDKIVRRFDELTTQVVEPIYRATVWFDRHRLAEIDGDIAGTPYRTDDPRWAAVKALQAASLVDQDLVRDYVSVASMLTTPDQVFSRPGVAGRVMALGAGAPQYPQPGPTRAELLAAVGA